MTSITGLGIPASTLMDSRCWLLDPDNRFGLLYCPVTGFLATYITATERWTLVGPFTFAEAVERLRADLPELCLSNEIATVWQARIEQTRGTLQ